MNRLLQFLPPSFIRAAGRLRFMFPVLRRPIDFLEQRVARTGRIAHGAGKGLLFDGRGCLPGYMTGTSEPLEQELVLKYSRPGGVVYDIGANVGFYAIIAARATGPSGTVYAFEPTADLAERIRSNAEMNSLLNLEVIEAAVCLENGMIEFETSPTHSVNSIRRISSFSERSMRMVNSTRLDTFSVANRPPDLLLVDVEGAEIEALESGLETISRFKPVIMAEVHGLGDKFIEFFDRALRPLDYVGSTYDGRPLLSEPVRYHALLVPNGQRILRQTVSNIRTS
jgi:FkbM family methyltransferase